MEVFIINFLIIGAILLIWKLFFGKNEPSRTEELSGQPSNRASKAFGEETEKLANRLSKIKFTVEMFKREILQQKDEEFPELYGAFFIGYIHGLTQEMCRWDGEGVEKEWGMVEVNDLHLTPVYQEVRRIWKMEDEIFSDEVKTKLKSILVSQSGGNGLSAGHLDGAYVCNTANQPPYFGQITSYFSNKNPTLIVQSDGAHHWYLGEKLHREDGPAVEDIDGTRHWFKNGQYFREDGPAIEWASGSKTWYKNGLQHRDDGPAHEGVDGKTSWMQNGLLHRIDGPAYIGIDGTKRWHFNGEYHREDGPAIESADGSKEWHLNGLQHRADGPAYEGADGLKEWWVNGKLHRADGPAIIYPNGLKEWRINGEFIKVETSDEN